MAFLMAIVPRRLSLVVPGASQLGVCSKVFMQTLETRITDNDLGTGSYSDPESFATAASNSDFQNCDIVYIPYFRKYFQYHDHCVKCGTLHFFTNEFQ